jgi:hypothetical protein
LTSRSGQVLSLPPVLSWPSKFYRTCHLRQSPVIVHMSLALLSIPNKLSFIKLTYGTKAHAIRSSFTIANLSWRHASFTHHCLPFPINPPNGHLNVRALSWATKFSLHPSGPLNDSDPNEEAVKSAVLEAIKGRQQTDLMLRCESASLSHCPFTSFLAQFYHHVGTVLDADGTRNAIRSYIHHYYHRLSSSVPIMRGFMSLHWMAPVYE